MEIHPRPEAHHSQDEGRVTVQRSEGQQTPHPAYTEAATISILLVDDHALIREGLRQLLSLESDLRVIDEATNG
jgi:PleD family two-component response regulator